MNGVRHVLLFTWLLTFGAVWPAQASLIWTYNSGSEVPVTASSYTASGSVTLTLNFAPVAGSSLTVVRNTGPGFISSTFDNLSQGQVIRLTYNGIRYTYVASYHGGTGNDLVLQWADVRPVAWGFNANGELGDGTAELAFPYSKSTPVQVTTSGALAGKVVVSLATGRTHSVALCSDGSLVTWGSNYYGQLGDGSTTDSLVPVAVNSSGVLAGRTVVAISAGTYHSLALCSDGVVIAWGRNFEGQLGDSSEANGLVPVLVATDGVLAGKTITAIAAGSAHSMAMTSDGKVFTWGDNANGELGNSLYPNSAVPIAVDNSSVLAGRTVVAISAGFYFSLALCSDGALIGWGYNAQGQLADNSTIDRFDPVLANTTGLLAGKTIVQLVSGGFHNLVLCSDGTMVAWGDNAYGSVGDGTTIDRMVPVAVDTTGALAGKTISHVSAGRYHSLARCTDGTLVAWGYHDYGQLGNASTANSSTPVVVNTALLSPVELFGNTGTGSSGDHSLCLAATLPVPVVANLSVSAVTAGTASLHGMVNPNSNATTAQFEYGLDTTYGSVANVTLSPNDGSTAQAVEAAITDLQPNRTYHYRLSATNAVGTVHTSSGTFATLFTDADLASLSISTGTLTPVFSGGVTEYTASVPHSASAITVTPAVAVPGATVQVNGTVAESGSPSGALNLNVGTNTIAVTVTAPGGSPVLTYTVIVSRLPLEMQVKGQGLAIANGDTLTSPTDGTDFGHAALLNTQVLRTFTVHNNASVPLVLNGNPRVTFTGPASSDFRILTPPAEVIAPGSSTSLVVQFDPKMPGLRNAFISIAYAESGGEPYTFAISGFGLLSTGLAQTITFTPPSTLYLGQTPLALSAYTSSGMPVTLSVLSGPATMAGNVLNLQGTGVIKVQATRASSGHFNAAAPVTRSITVKANPTALTLLNLNQTYNGTPRSITTLGSATPPTITYLVSGAYISEPPVNASSYKVRAEAGGVVKTGTLVIAKAPLYVTPDDQRKFAGQPNPPNLTVRYSGLIGSDTDQVVIKKPIVKTTATTTSPGGQYPITASGATAANYLLIYQRSTLVVESFAGAYEALLLDATPLPVAKLKLTVSSNSRNFTATLATPWETSALSLSGTLTTDSGNELATGAATYTKGGNNYAVNVSVPLLGQVTASATRNSAVLGTANDGEKRLVLAKGKGVSYSGAHTAHLQPCTPSGDNVPQGAGWATAAINTTGTLALAGKLPDGTAFSASLAADGRESPGYCLFLQPYAPARVGTYVAGKFDLQPHPDLAGRRYLPAASLTWTKARRDQDPSYRSGFGPVSSVLTLDPWQPPVTAKGAVPAITLAQRLGLIAPGNAFAVQHAPTGSAAHGNLPLMLALNSASTVSVTAPLTVPANSTKWKMTVVSSTGTFTGSFELIDDPHKRPVPFSGVLRQPASTSPDAVIGDGHFVLPALPGAPSNEKLAGEVLLERP